MYVRHKKARVVVRLSHFTQKEGKKLSKCGYTHWATDREGRKFLVNSAEYENIIDAFDRIYCRVENSFEEAEKYAFANKEELNNIKEVETREWIEWVLKEMKEQGKIRNAFADGSRCGFVEVAFLGYVKAASLYKQWDDYDERFIPSTIKTFKFYGRNWIVDGGDIIEIKLKEV